MKKKKITRSDIQKIRPPMPATFEQKALETLRNLPWTEEEPVMKRKFSMGLILALVLILTLTAVAFAVSLWRDTAEQIAPMEAEKGYFEDWTSEDRIELLRLLNNAKALPDDTRIAEVLNGHYEAQEAGVIATDIITSWAGHDEEMLTFQNISAALNGKPFAQWSAEDKAWFRQTLGENGMLSSEELVYEVPTGEDINETRAVEIGQAALTKEYDLAEDYLDSFEVSAMFFTPAWEVEGIEQGETIWAIEFTKNVYENEKDRFYVLIVEMKRDGTVIDMLRNDPYDLQSQMDEMTQEKGVWYEWSPEDQAEWSAYLAEQVPIAQAAGEEVRGYLVALGNTKFGFPSENDMPREEAIERATKYVKEKYGATDNGLSKLKVYTSFDVTDSEKHIWRVKFLASFTEDDSDYESTAYVVHVDATTGEIHKSLKRPEDVIKAVDLM